MKNHPSQNSSGCIGGTLNILFSEPLENSRNACAITGQGAEAGEDGLLAISIEVETQPSEPTNEHAPADPRIVINWWWWFVLCDSARRGQIVPQRCLRFHYSPV